jgi:hypothetical protein
MRPIGRPNDKSARKWSQARRLLTIVRVCGRLRLPVAGRLTALRAMAECDYVDGEVAMELTR